MIPSKFDYTLAESVEHAIELLGQDPEAKLLAGGHSLIPLMKTRLARPSRLIDIGRLGLAGVTDGGDHLVVGALTRHADLEHDAGLHVGGEAFLGDFHAVGSDGEIGQDERAVVGIDDAHTVGLDEALAVG